MSTDATTGARALSLHQLIAPEMPPTDFIRLAGELNCPYVCVFTQVPGDGAGLPVIGDDEVDEVAELMGDVGVRAHGITSFPMLPETNPLDYLGGLNRGAKLGATRANVRILDKDGARVVRNFRVFADLCAGAGLLATIEFTGYRDPGALPCAIEIVRAAGAGAITLDMLHLVRTGTTWETLERLDPSLIGYLQFCDGPMTATAEQYDIEGPFDRLAPGDGEFPLARFLTLMPAALPLSLEIPSRSLRSRGLDGQAVARHVVARTRQFLDGEAPAH